MVSSLIPHPSSLPAHRRRIWFASCKELGLSDDDQQAIAAGVIPEKYPGKFKSDGSVSRQPLFENNRLWLKANAHLKRLRGKRVKSHRRHDGSRSVSATSRQLVYARDLARQLGWGVNGEDELDYRLGRFAARQLGDGKGSVRMLSHCTASDLHKIIEGLKSMLARSSSSSPSSSSA